MTLHLISHQKTLLDQWRSGIVQLGQTPGLCQHRLPGQRLAELLTALQDMPSDDLLLLDHPVNASSEDLSDLDQWLRIRPHVHVLLLSEDNSKSLLIQAMKVGVREVLPLPMEPQVMVESLRRWTQRLAVQPSAAVQAKTDTPGGQALAPAAPAAPGRLVAFMGCKGGNGTSFLAANMAYIMATEFDRHCAFMDLDLQSGDASFYLGSGANKNTLSDLTRQIDRLDAQLLTSCLHAITPRLNLLAAPHTLDKAMTISAQDIEKILTLVRSQHDHVVVDLPRTLNALSLKVLDLADVVYIVMQNHTPDVRDAQRLVSNLQSLGLSEGKLRLLVNRYEPGGWVSLSDLEKAVGLKTHQTIPSQPQWVGEALHTGQPLSQVHDRNAVMHALRQTTEALLDTHPSQQRRWMERWWGQRA